MNDKPGVTVFTPVFNRKHTIDRPFDSLMRQTCKDFEWLVIDDGSTDGIKETIDIFAEKADFSVRYYFKENGGKHTAMNMAAGLARGGYFLVLDSDDALTDNAVELIFALWGGIPEKGREKYWCVTGLCVDSETGKIIGDRYPEGINQQANPKLLAQKTTGDKTGCIRTEILSAYPFPEPAGTNFITESIIWNKIDKSYSQYYSNEILKVVYLNEPDSLTAVWFKEHVREGYVSNYYWKLSTLNDIGIHKPKDCRTLFTVPYYGLMAGKKRNEIIGGVQKPVYKTLVALLMVPAGVFKVIRGNRHIKNVQP